ncbi:MAG: polyamine aminopropyltransferase [Desulfobacterales bacterium]|nr:polyamine aminopropyltransferase [Desulfobacterales bacterium]
MTTETGPDLWVREIYKGVMGLSFKVEKTLFSGHSPFQQVDVVKTAGHGAMLLNDGMVMLSERDEFVYHEMIAHVPLFVHPHPETVLVIGGGDGGTVREVLKHSTVRRAVMVEIDEMVVEACKKHLPSVSCALDDPRLELRIEDGVKFVAETEERFDVVVIDSTDPIGAAKPLFNRAFYENVAGILTEKGILVSQAESPFYDDEIQRAMLANQRPYFKRLHLYLFANLTYPGGLWSFGFASRGLCPAQDFVAGRVAASAIDFRYYNADVHRAAFALPTFVAKTLRGITDPI